MVWKLIIMKQNVYFFLCLSHSFLLSLYFVLLFPTHPLKYCHTSTYSLPSLTYASCEFLSLSTSLTGASTMASKPHPPLMKKHSQTDLISRLKSRKILGVGGEDDDGEVHRSKVRLRHVNLFPSFLFNMGSNADKESKLLVH